MEKLKEYRKKNGLSQVELGTIVGVKPNTISGYEKGTREPSQDNLIKLAIALDCSVDDLLDFKKIQEEIGEEIRKKVEEKRVKQ